MSDEQIEMGIGVRAQPDRVWLDLFCQDASLGMTPDQAMSLGQALLDAGKTAKEAVEH